MKKFFGILLLVLVIAGLTLGMMGLLMEGSNPSHGAPGGAPAPSASESADPVSQPTLTVIEDLSGKIHRGSVVQTNFYAITYGECDSDWKGYDSLFHGPEAGKKVVRAYFSIENIDTSDHEFYYTDFDCYADGVDCKIYTHYYGRDDRLSIGRLSPGRIAQGYLYFEVPANAGEIELEYSCMSMEPERLIFVVE